MNPQQPAPGAAPGGTPAPQQPQQAPPTPQNPPRTTPTTPATPLDSQAPTPPATPSSAVNFEPNSPKQTYPIQDTAASVPQRNSTDVQRSIGHDHFIRRLKGFGSLVAFIVGVVIAVVLINQFIFQSYYVDGSSMTPTLQNNDRLIIDKVEKSWDNLQGHAYIPQRGQIVVLDSSLIGVGGQEEQLIKRVIGLPGDTVHIADGVVTIKNKDHPEGFNVDEQLGLDLEPTYSATPIETAIPENQVFVMGDNRKENGSYDSRAFGPIEASKIVGRLWARILPVDQAQIF